MQTFEEPRTMQNGSGKNGISVPPMAAVPAPAQPAPPLPFAPEPFPNQASTPFGDDGQLRPPPMTTAQEPKPAEPEPEEDDGFAMPGLHRKGKKKKGLF
jgi:hypothetical protein